MQIEIDTDRYKELFGGYDFTRDFQSKLPGHDVLLDALSDPSVAPEHVSEIKGEDVLRSCGVEDFHRGAQYMLQRLVTRFEGGLTNASTGVLSVYKKPVELVAKHAFALRSAISEGEVEQFFLDAAFAGGMQALGAIGPVGKVAAAIVGFAREIVQLFQNRQEMEAADELRRQQLAFMRAPPLQQPRKETDEWYVNRVVIPTMEGGSWTKLFAPRFDPIAEWKGIERNGGFAFAPGTSVRGSTDEFGREVDVFERSDGVGLIPGLDQITSVIQVSFDPLDPSIEGWRNGNPGGVHWPIRPEMVTDVGRYYVNTARLCSVAWAWATQQDASPNLYKVYVGKADTSGVHLQAQWRSYCAKGIRYLQDNAEDYLNGKKQRILSGNLEYLFGSAISCAVGTWTCTWSGGTTLKPNYLQVQPGRARDRMNDGVQLRVDDWLGCVMDPRATVAVGEGKACFRSLYDTHIRDVLVEVRARQVHFLRHSLVCAYVREAWDAFRDLEMLDLLRKQRQILLTHPDRFHVVLADVPEAEPMPGGGELKKKLIEAGVKSIKPAALGLAAAAGPAIEPAKEPAPRVRVSPEPMDFGGRPERCGRTCLEERERQKAQSQRKRWFDLAAYAAGGAALAGVGLWAWRETRREEDEP